VPQRCDADTRHQIEVLAAIDVIQTRALAAHERHRLTPVGLEHVLGLSLLNVVECDRHRTTCVQPASGARASASVSSLISLPPAITTSPTPCCSAARQACSFATMPLFAVPALTSRAASRLVSFAI